MILTAIAGQGLPKKELVLVFLCEENWMPKHQRVQIVQCFDKALLGQELN